MSSDPSPSERGASGPSAAERRPSRRPAPAPAPTLTERAATALRFTFGMALVVLRYFWHASAFRRNEVAGGPDDLPPPIPDTWVDDDVKTLAHGHGPLFHREFSVRMTGPDISAAGLVDRLCADLDRAAPTEVVTFRKIRGDVGTMATGDEYRVRIPAPWDGPVVVVRRDAASFRFATLRGHLEAGQIEFRATDETAGPMEGAAVRFTIETWSRAGTPLAHVVFGRLRIGKEAQLNMWAQFCLAVPRLTGARRTGPVRITTRRWDDPVT